MDSCPKCESNRVRRSRAKGFFERLRRDFSQKKLFRCHACGWRGWGIETERPPSAQETRGAEVAPPDVHAIDLALQKAIPKPGDTAQA